VSISEVSGSQCIYLVPCVNVSPVMTLNSLSPERCSG
jgi:hypothetical protein